MKINKPRSVKKLTLTSSILLLALFISFGMIYFYHGNTLLGWNPFGTKMSSEATDHGINMSPATDEEITDGNNTKTQTVTESTKPDQENDSANQQTTSNSHTVEITTARQSNGMIQIRSIITPVTANGSCTLTFTNSAKQTLTKTSDVQAASSYSSCQGFDISVNEFPTAGTWTMVLAYNDDSGTVSATSQIEVSK